MTILYFMKNTQYGINTVGYAWIYARVHFIHSSAKFALQILGNLKKQNVMK